MQILKLKQIWKWPLNPVKEEISKTEQYKSEFLIWRFEQNSDFFFFFLKLLIFECSDLSTRLQLNSQHSGNLLLILFPVHSLVISLALLLPLAQNLLFKHCTDFTIFNLQELRRWVQWERSRYRIQQTVMWHHVTFRHCNIISAK